MLGNVGRGEKGSGWGQRREQADGEAGERERDLKEGEERAVYSFSKLLSLCYFPKACKP
jgi:hypothetical protein